MFTNIFCKAVPDFIYTSFFICLWWTFSDYSSFVETQVTVFDPFVLIQGSFTNIQICHNCLSWIRGTFFCGYIGIFIKELSKVVFLGFNSFRHNWLWCRPYTTKVTIIPWGLSNLPLILFSSRSYPVLGGSA